MDVFETLCILADFFQPFCRQGLPLEILDNAVREMKDREGVRGERWRHWVTRRRVVSTHRLRSASSGGTGCTGWKMTSGAGSFKRRMI